MTEASPARRAALQIVRDVTRGGGTLAERLAQRSVEALDPRERDFVHELVHGVLRRRGALDAALTPLIDRGLQAVDGVLLDVLRLGAYQLLHTRVPARAAVFESVALAREVAPRGAGFANAVLRRLASEGAPPAVSADADPSAWLVGEGSLPPWLAARWLAQLGADDAVARARAFLATPQTFLRMNPRIADAAARLADANLVVRPGDVPGSFAVDTGKTQSLAAAGIVYVQDEGSQLVAHLARCDSGLVLDACAAPGGKATLLADLGPSARVIAMEPSPRRLSVLERTVDRWGAGGVSLLGADALRIPLRPVFDVALLDAPCTGLGTLARRPDLRWRVSEADIGRHATRQRRMIESVAGVLRPGGRLVYSTCSLEPEETNEVVESFLDASPSFALETPAPIADRFREGPYVRLRPERRGGDGFFVACLTRVA